VEKRLAACVNQIPGISSWYWWEDKVTEDQEVLLVMKSSRERFDELEKEVLRLHSYAIPEVIALPIVEGSKNYLNWIEDSLKGS
jgi:periplasmic divalent cation tolerance protein